MYNSNQVNRFIVFSFFINYKGDQNHCMKGYDKLLLSDKTREVFSVQFHRGIDLWYDDFFTMKGHRVVLVDISV